jgi:hypothetical protein
MEFERILLRNGFGVIEIVSECRECPERYRKSSGNILKCLEYKKGIFGLFLIRAWAVLVETKVATAMGLKGNPTSPRRGRWKGHLGRWRGHLLP